MVAKVVLHSTAFEAVFLHGSLKFEHRSIWCLEKEMATHSSVLAWRIPGRGSLVGCRLWGRIESDTIEATQQLHGAKAHGFSTSANCKESGSKQMFSCYSRATWALQLDFCATKFWFMQKFSLHSINEKGILSKGQVCGGSSLYLVALSELQ